MAIKILDDFEESETNECKDCQRNGEMCSFARIGLCMSFEGIE